MILRDTYVKRKLGHRVTADIVAAVTTCVKASLFLCLWRWIAVFTHKNLSKERGVSTGIVYRLKKT